MINNCKILLIKSCENLKMSHYFSPKSMVGNRFLIIPKILTPLSKGKIFSMENAPAEMTQPNKHTNKDRLFAIRYSTRKCSVATMRLNNDYDEGANISCIHLVPETCPMKQNWSITSEIICVA
jgi:hypothetical protein